MRIIVLYRPFITPSGQETRISPDSFIPAENATGREGWTAKRTESGRERTRS